MQYNPPFIYCMAAYTMKSGSRQVVAGLGNGMLLRFKRKGLELQEICGDTGHADQISSLYLESAKALMVTASHDKTMAIHRMAQDCEQLIEKTVLRVQVPEKVNEIVGYDTGASSVVPDLLVGDVSPIISRFVIKS